MSSRADNHGLTFSSPLRLSSPEAFSSSSVPLAPSSEGGADSFSDSSTSSSLSSLLARTRRFNFDSRAFLFTEDMAANMLCILSFLVAFAAIATTDGQIYGGPCYRSDKATLSDFRYSDSGTTRQKLISRDNKVRAVLSLFHLRTRLSRISSIRHRHSLPLSSHRTDETDRLTNKSAIFIDSLFALTVTSTITQPTYQPRGTHYSTEQATKQLPQRYKSRTKLQISIHA